MDHEGQTLTASMAINDHFQHYYYELLGVQEQQTGTVDIAIVRQGVVFNVDQQLALIRPFTKHDVQRALWSIPEHKSPGLDGYGSGFFKAVWGEGGCRS